MTHAISRIFATKADADAAIEDLVRSGFRSEQIFVVGPPAGEAVDQIADKIAKTFIVRRRAEAYARQVAKGAVFVTVHAPFGSGRRAEVVLDRHDPVAFSVEPPPLARERYNEATPLSSVFGLPVLSNHPTPCGAFLGLPSLISSDWTLRSTIAGAPAPLSHFFGLPVMTANGETTSEGLRLATLTATGDTTSSRLGLPTVMANGRPLGFGLPLVTAKGRPTSLGLPLVTSKGRPTSLGLPLLW